MGWGTVRLIFGYAILPLFATVIVASSPAAQAQSLPLEFKILLDTQKSADAIAQKLSFSRFSAEHSDVYFFDTKDLRLFNADLYIRAREVNGGNGEIVVKARPVDKDDVDPSWFRVPGFSCELDGTDLKTIPSCSVRENRPSRDLQSVMSGGVPLERLMTQDQRDFANDFGGFAGIEKKIRMLGPISAWRWRVASASGWKVDAEYWKLPNGDSYIELSIHGMESDQGRMSEALQLFVKQRGLDVAPLTANKTAKVLKALASAI